MKYRITWTPYADQVLVEGWREGKSLVELCCIIPGKPKFLAVKQRIQRLRKAGIELPYRKSGSNSADAQRARRLALLREAKARYEERQAAREAESQHRDLFAGVTFPDHPDALAEPIFVIKLIPPGIGHRLTYEGLA